MHLFYYRGAIQFFVRDLTSRASVLCAVKDLAVRLLRTDGVLAVGRLLPSIIELTNAARRDRERDYWFRVHFRLLSSAVVD